jgi:hypothetical protein
VSGLAVELLPEGTAATDAVAVPVVWPAEAGRTATFRVDLGWHQVELGAPLPAAKDLLRVVTAAYVADKTAPKPGLGLLRPLDLTVHVEQPDTWTTTAKEQVVDLLHWLTGDDWGLRCVPAAVPAGPPRQLDLPMTDDIALLSGGLDSFCGALIRIRQPGTVRFLAHADTSKAVRHAQQRLQKHLAALTPPRVYEHYALAPGASVRNYVPKTRSLLFMAMGVAAATGSGAARVLVPENGFTSINPPLEPSRGGVMTTRSTHPWTFHSVAGLLGTLGLDRVSVLNPYGALTKGELVGQALAGAGEELLDLAAETVSCAKMNAGRPKKGNANVQCGLCVACLVRRAAFIGAAVPDRTPYACDGTSSVAAHTRRVRRHDVDAWRTATEPDGGIPEHRVLASGLWPPGTDLDAVLALCQRGLKELARVPV